MSARTFQLTLAILLFTNFLRAQVPQIINYQGRVLARNLPHRGSGLFKFSLVNSSWNLSGNVPFAAGNGARGVTGIVSGSTVTLFASDTGFEAAFSGEIVLSLPL